MADATTTMESDVLTRDQVAVEDTWDLDGIFPSGEAWESALAGSPALIEAVAAYRGRLGEGAAVVREAFDALYHAEDVLGRVMTWASLRRDEDTTDVERNGRYERAVAVAIQAGSVLAFLQPELIALPEGSLPALAADPQLATYKHLLEDLERQRAHVRSEEVEEVLAQFSDVTRAPSDAFNALDNADLSYGKVRDEHGTEIELTKGRFAVLQESRDREVRKNAHLAYTQAYLDHGYTLASLYGSSVRKDVVGARIRGYESARQAALFDDNLPDSVYDGLIETVRGGTDILQRYLDLRRRALGVDQLERYDLRVPLAPEPPLRYSYREGVDVVLGGVSALGERYVTDLRNGFDSRWVDVHETKGKRSGAYSWGTYGAPPVILMNWNGTLSDVFTLAHEAGHAMHTFYANAAQPIHLASYPIFLAEIASTVNEVLLTWHLLGREEALDPVVRFSLLNQFADTYFSTVVTQTMFADFEAVTHAAVEAGAPLTRDFLMETFGDLQRVYTPGVNVDERVAIGWGRIPHFYRAFYVFKYATGLSAAINIARAVRDEGEPARERYLAMLSAGGSDYPLDILKQGGVDLTTPEPVQIGLGEFDATVTELERLANEGVLEEAAARLSDWADSAS
ncbi:MAG: oligoendopeptidase F [Thermomicrobiales bacterium]